MSDMIKSVFDPRMTPSGGDARFAQIRQELASAYEASNVKLPAHVLNSLAAQMVTNEKYAAGVARSGAVGRTAFEGAHLWAPKVSNALENVTTANVANFTTQIIATIPMIFEALHIDNLVTTRPMTAGPRAYVQTQSFTYANAGTLYEAGTDLDANLDPDYADSPGECEVSNKIDWSNSLRTITAVTKRLSAKWSGNAAEDAAAMFGVGLPSELRQIIAFQIAREIQQHHLSEMVANAGQSASWVATPAGTYASLDPKVWKETLWSQALTDIQVDMRNSVDVAKGFNRIAGRPTEIGRLMKLDTFRAPGAAFNASAGSAHSVDLVRYQSFVDSMGTADMRVYEYENLAENTLLCVLKDDARPVQLHAPYVNLQDLGMFLDPETSCYTIGVKTRYATDTTIANGLGVVNITPES